MRTGRPEITVTMLAVLSMVAVAASPGIGAEVDKDPIRLGQPSSDNSLHDTPDPGDALTHGKRSFDYEAFESRLQNLWFQRKALLVEGRQADVARQSELIRDFCAEEGVGRLQGLADALLVEANRFLEEGSYERALASLEMAESLDPGRSQTRFARAAVFWRSDNGFGATAAEYLGALGASLNEGFRDFTLMNQVILVLVISILATTALFSIVMMTRYQIPFRHEVEELCLRTGKGRWGSIAGWGLLMIPMLLWVTAGWTAFFWIALLIRFFKSRERAAAVFLLLLTVISVPAGRAAVAIYGLTTDPVVRTTLEAARGVYSPERVVKLQNLVATYPEDATYRFLLAGLYKNGRYFEEAYKEYKEALGQDPALYQAYINIGNIYFVNGQHTEAVVQYHKALDLKPNSVLAYYNMHLAQAEAFRFDASRESLDRARSLDSERVTHLMTEEGRETERAMVVDAGVRLDSIWQAALAGGKIDQHMRLGQGGAQQAGILSQFFNPISGLSLLTILACGAILLLNPGGRHPAGRCVRCGNPFCQYCKSGREGHDYCNPCIHLFVLGDGLAPETKTRKLYEVGRYERNRRRVRKILGVFLPGLSQLLGGHVFRGITLLLAWFAALATWQPLVLRPVEIITGLDLRLDLIVAGAVPSVFYMNPWSMLGLALALLTWLVANVHSLRLGKA